MASNNANKRNREQRNRDVAEFGDLRTVRGWTWQQIADSVGPGKKIDRPYVLSLHQVRKDVKKAELQWVRDNEVSVKRLIARQIKRLDNLYVESLAGLERSKLPRERRKTSKRTMADRKADMRKAFDQKYPMAGADKAKNESDSAKPKGIESIHSEIEIEQRDGNPQWAEAARRIIADQSELLKLKQPIKLEAEGAGVESRAKVTIEFGEDEKSYATGLSALVSALRGEALPAPDPGGSSEQHRDHDGVSDRPGEGVPGPLRTP